MRERCEDLELVGHHNRGSALLGVAFDPDEQDIPKGPIHPFDGFVEEQALRGSDPRRRESRAPPLTLRKFTNRPIAQIFQTHPLEGWPGFIARPASKPAHPIDTRGEKTRRRAR